MYEISIIVPIYNVETYIEKCFESIIKQKNMYDVEIICIDDGSTDNSGLICDKYAKKDKRFKVIHQNNSGVARTRNLGLDLAQGKYIAWIDPDDYISDDWYEKIKVFIKKDIDVIFFDHILLTDNKIKKVKYEKSSRFIKKEKFLKELVLNKKIQSQLWSKIIKRCLFNGIRMPVELNLLEDYSIIHCVIERADNIYYISDCLYYYLVRKNSLAHVDINIEIVYKTYLIAKDRYEYLIKKNIKVPKTTYLIKAITVCLYFYKLEKFSEKEVNEFNICKKELDNNIKYILLSKDVPIILKVIILFYKLGMLRILSKIKNI